MSKIVITAPCHTIHRFVLPPHARHVLHHHFKSGAVVLAKIVARLLNVWSEELRRDFDEKLAASISSREARFDAELPVLRKDWEEQLASDLTKLDKQLEREGVLTNKTIQNVVEDRKAYNQRCLDQKEIEQVAINKAKAQLPDRFVRLEPYAATPAMKRSLEPDTKFLRVLDKEDGEGFDEQTHGKFQIDNCASVKRDVFVVGGTKINDATADEVVPSNPNQGGVLYIIGRTVEAIESHCRRWRAKDKMVKIAQIDLSDLAKDYPIQTDTSYDRTVADICSAKRCKPSREPDKPDDEDRPRTILEFLDDEQLDHLIVRIGNAACVVVSRKGDKAKPEAHLFYHPERCAPTTFPGLGQMLAYDLLLNATLVHKLATAEDVYFGLQTIKNGLETAVRATYQCFTFGFGQLGEKKSIDDLAKIPPEILFSETIQKAQHREDGKTANFVQVNLDHAISTNKFLRIVVGNEGDASNDKLCFELASGYIGNSWSLPTVDIGKLKLVDRHEIEDYLFLQRLLLDYHADTKWTRPLSIGVFGQPGGGKSFGVTQLINEMSGDAETFSKKPVTINLSQIRSLDELSAQFHRIRDACLKGPMPLVFFDEFDSSFENHAFGWLKYFLAPMQDSEFFDKGQTYSFGRAIFVFAGGLSHSFSEFNERSRNPDFCNAKGPDFISRLRGVLNIKGVNAPDGDSVEHIYMIRRSVLLRNMIEGKVGKTTNGLIQGNLLKAFLRIPHFKHGVRSMEAIIQMSSIQHGQRFTLSNLPPRDQLDMHVDAREFLRLADVPTPRGNG